MQLERIPEHLRGRVFGLVNAGAWAGIPFGALLGGVAADTIGLAVAFGIVAVVYTTVTLTPLDRWRLAADGASTGDDAAITCTPAVSRADPGASAGRTEPVSRRRVVSSFR